MSATLTPTPVYIGSTGVKNDAIELEDSMFLFGIFRIVFKYLIFNIKQGYIKSAICRSKTERRAFFFFHLLRHVLLA